MRTAKSAGKKPEDVAASWTLPEEYKVKSYVLTANPAQAQQRLKDNVTNLYNEIK